MNQKNTDKKKSTNIEDIHINAIGNNNKQQKSNYPWDIQGLFERLGIE